jgi:hypothetical protein
MPHKLFALERRLSPTRQQLRYRLLTLEQCKKESIQNNWVFKIYSRLGIKSSRKKRRIKMHVNNAGNFSFGLSFA